MLAVALGDARADALLGEAAHLVAQELLVLGEREVDAGGAAVSAVGSVSTAMALRGLLRPC